MKHIWTMHTSSACFRCIEAINQWQRKLQINWGKFVLCFECIFEFFFFFGEFCTHIDNSRFEANFNMVFKDFMYYITSLQAALWKYCFFYWFYVAFIIQFGYKFVANITHFTWIWLWFFRRNAFIRNWRGHLYTIKV